MKYTKEQHLAHVAAWWDGKLERNGMNGWVASEFHPETAEDPSNYRIRPEPRLRPWKPEEVPLDCWFRNRGAEASEGRWKLLVVSRLGIVTAHGSANNNDALALRSFEFALERLEHSTDGGRTWLPCGVEESQ